MLTKLKAFFTEPASFEPQEIPGFGYGIVKVTWDKRETVPGKCFLSLDAAVLESIKMSLQ